MISQPFVPFIFPPGIVPVHPGLFEVGSGGVQVGRGLVSDRGHVDIFHAGDDLPLLDLASLLDHQRHQTARDFGCNRGFPLRDDVAAGIQQGDGLRWIERRDGCHINGNGGDQDAAVVKAAGSQKQQHDNRNSQRQPAALAPADLFRLFDFQFCYVFRRHDRLLKTDASVAFSILCSRTCELITKSRLFCHTDLWPRRLGPGRALRLRSDLN